MELPGERTRKDDLDRTCPDLELAAIGSRDTSGQGPDSPLRLAAESGVRRVSVRRAAIPYVRVSDVHPATLRWSALSPLEVISWMAAPTGSST